MKDSKIKKYQDACNKILSVYKDDKCSHQIDYYFLGKKEHSYVSRFDIFLPIVVKHIPSLLETLKPISLTIIEDYDNRLYGEKIIGIICNEELTYFTHRDVPEAMLDEILAVKPFDKITTIEICDTSIWDKYAEHRASTKNKPTFKKRHRRFWLSGKLKRESYEKSIY